MAVTVLDLDVTKNCNLRCVYCFKRERVHARAPSMDLETATAAIDWLIAASYSADQLWVNLMGGEPLLQYALIRQIVPYAKRRAASHGKGIQFGCTTNLTLVTEGVAAFFREWGMGWHCSIDGPPVVQDAQRPGTGRGATSAAAERGARIVLRDRPGAMARATVTPRFVGNMLDSLRYFESLGFVSFGFGLAEPQSWRAGDLAGYETQMSLMRQYIRDEWYHKGVDKWLGAFDWYMQCHARQEERSFSCGAGRGTVLVDERGDLWPCHRWDGSDGDAGHGGAWRLGNIFSGRFDHMLHLALLDRDRTATRTADCFGCELKRACAGGCPAANLAEMRSVYETHPTSCALARIACKHALELHDELYAERNELFMRKFYDKNYRRPDSFSPSVPHPA